MKEPIDYRVPRTEENIASYEQLFCDVTDAVWPINATPDEEELARIAQATPGQRALYVATLFARLAGNGGVASFFTAAGFYSQVLEESLQLLGAQDMLQSYRDGLDDFDG